MFNNVSFVIRYFSFHIKFYLPANLVISHAKTDKDVNKINCGVKNSQLPFAI